jgi:hypothetical protein
VSVAERSPPSPDDTAAWDHEALKLMIVHLPTFHRYARSPEMNYGCKGWDFLGFGKHLMGHTPGGDALTQACRRIAKEIGYDYNKETPRY